MGNEGGIWGKQTFLLANLKKWSEEVEIKGFREKIRGRAGLRGTMNRQKDRVYGHSTTTSDSHAPVAHAVTAQRAVSHPRSFQRFTASKPAASAPVRWAIL
jgi:hypothetical protein